MEDSATRGKRGIFFNRLFRKGNTYCAHTTCTSRTCGLLELNSKITTVFIDESDVKSCLFQCGENKEGRQSSVTEER